MEDEHVLKRQDTTESPRRSGEKREAAEVEEEAEKRQKAGESSEGKYEGAEVHMDEEKDAVRPTRPAEHEAEGSPSGKIAKLYPPHYAGIQSVEAHGDEELGLEHIPEEMSEEMQYSYGGEEDGDPPDVTQEELDALDKEATKVEIERMLKIPAMEESTNEEVRACSGYTISTRLVYTWKHRVEQGGWFRRARLVARQFKASVEADQTFAPTSLMIIPKMMIHVLLNVCAGFTAMTLDIKDAFLMADQPAEEKAFIKDDVFMVGTPQILQEFVMFLKSVKKWKVEAKGPFTAGEKFLYLKRQFKITEDHCDIRCDRKQYYGLEKELDLFCKAYRKTPLDQNFTKKDDSPLLEAEEVTKFRSIVGRLMYMASERPDAQFGIQCLARKMSAPTKQALKNAWHLCSYLQGTIDYGVRLSRREKGRSVLDTREEEEINNGPAHLVEVLTDADYAGNRDDRKSTTSFQVYIDGNLIESRVRTQKAIALSSGESEFVAVVAGCSDGMLIKHLLNKMTGGSCLMKVRTDSSAARSMVQRQGIGRVRHLDASLLWVQQKESERAFSIAAIPSELNSADIGTKSLTKKRLLGLLYMMKFVDAVGDRVGTEEYKDLEYQYQIKKGTMKMMKSKDIRIGLLLLMARMNSVAGSPIEQEEKTGNDYGWWALVLCAAIGALSTLSWLRIFMIEGLYGMLGQMIKYETSARQETTSQKCDQQTQATEWIDSYIWQQYEEEKEEMEEEMNNMQAALLEAEEMIGHLQEDLKEVRRQRDDHLNMFLKSQQQQAKLEKKFCNLRKAPSGHVIHFDSRCRYWQKASEAAFCSTCQDEGAVSEHAETSNRIPTGQSS